MKISKKIGIWMDHSVAHLTEIDSEIQETKIITSESAFQRKIENKSIFENEKQLTIQQQQITYYKNLAQIIKDFDEVILSGPTKAKQELYFELKENPQFDAIHIEVDTTDKMSSKEQLKFIDGYSKRFDFWM